MAITDERVRERIAFLSQPADRLRSVKGRGLYDTLQGLGLSHQQFFRALDTTTADYCAQEFGVDLGRITVERFFGSDPNAKWLFPDIVREAVVEGMRRGPQYPGLIVRDEPVNGTHYDVPYVEENEDEEALRGVAEGAAIPESAIEYGSRTVKLEKQGRGVIASYEVIRRMSVDLLRVHLMRIGARLGRHLDARLAMVLADGDRSGETEPLEMNTAAAGTWAYGDLLAGYLKLLVEHGFTPTHMIANAALAQTILTLPEFKDAALFDSVRSGNLPTPLGTRLVPMVDQPANRVTILDRDYAVQKVTEQDLLVESDKLIHQQWDRTYLTVVTDFAIVYDKARVVVRSDWS